MQEGKHFLINEELILAKAWTHQSIKVTNQSDYTMWNGISEYPKSAFNFICTPSSFHFKWCTIRTGVTHYIAAKDNVMNGTNSGWTEEELAETTMEFYNETAGRIYKNGGKKKRLNLNLFPWYSFFHNYQSLMVCQQWNNSQKYQNQWDRLHEWVV